MFEKISKISLKVFSGCNFNCSFCHQLLNDKNQPYEFTDYEKLYDFLLSIPLDEFVDITITGGEITLAPEKLYQTIKVLKKIERVIDVKFDICIITNGSNMDLIYEWCDKKIICPYKTSISWDGIHNSLSRHSNISDEYYLDELKKLGKSAYNDTISIVHSINPYNIDFLFDSFKYCYENNVKNVGYYFIHEANYENMIDKFTFQLEKIAEYYFNNQKNNIRFYNWELIYSTKLYKKNFYLCNKLGNNYHIDMFGDIYPCIYFGDHRLFKIGNIKTGLDNEKIKLFELLYSRKPSCQYYKCNCTQCSECPASNFVHNKDICKRFENLCLLHKIELDIYNKYNIENKNLNIKNDILYSQESKENKKNIDYNFYFNDNTFISPNFEKVRKW